MHNSSKQPIGLVIGLCSHGLAMTRALQQHDVEVHAFEAKPSLPGVLTNSAKVHVVRSIKENSLVEDLLSFRKQFPEQQKIVLFPTNDNNVKVIGNHIDVLNQHFLISWHHCADDILALLKKSNIEQRCTETGLNYPQSFVLSEPKQLQEVSRLFEFPVIAKPVNPQSGFKALKCDTPDELKGLIKKYHDDLPILVQHWISGTDVDIFFGALYLDRGKVLARFAGNKLESFPPAMGQTTVAITCDNEEVLSLTETFFAGLALSGPVSLELKRDEKGRYWVIEPTIGRTDFWVGLCVSAGCNLLAIEYDHCIDKEPHRYDLFTPTIWFDSERDVTAFPRHIGKSLPWKKDRLSPTFSYLTKADVQPSIRAMRQACVNVSTSLLKRVNKTNIVKLPDAHNIKVYETLAQLPMSFKTLLKQHADQCIFTSDDWFANFCNEVACIEGTTQFVCLSDQDGGALALLPLWLRTEQVYGIQFAYLTSLTNYYSPIFDFIIDDNKTTKPRAMREILAFLKARADLWHVLDIQPVTEELAYYLSVASKELKLTPHVYNVTRNWFETISDDYTTYFNSLSSRTRNTIKRKKNKLSKNESWEIVLYQDDKQLEKGIEDYHDVYQNSWKPKEPYPDFVSELIRTAARNKWLRLGILYINEQPVAAQLWLHANNKAYIYKLAYKDMAKEYSPGSILTAFMMENAIAKEGIGFIDFLTGKDEFKREWMTQSRELFGIQIDNKASAKSVLFAAKNQLSALKARFRGEKAQ